MRMKICFITKYPPLQGGTASRAYWLIKSLGERGHEVHVVTNAWEADRACRVRIDAADLDREYRPTNVFVHTTDPFIKPAYIPYAEPHIATLASLAVDVIRQNGLQIIDSWYMLPYVVSGFLARTVTGRPQILRHAGSDISRLFQSPYLKTLFVSIFKSVDRIVTGPDNRDFFLDSGVDPSRLFLESRRSIDTGAFHPGVKPADLSAYLERPLDGRPVITYIGKLNRTKGIYELVEAAAGIKRDFFLLFVTDGKNLEGFKKMVARKGLGKKALFIRFLAPWKIPGVIKRSTCVVAAERDFTVVQHTPVLPREVMATGRCLVLSGELYQRRFSRTLTDGRDVLVVDPKDIRRFREVLEKIIVDPRLAEGIGKQALIASRKREDFEAYVDGTVDLYRRLIRKR